MHEEWERWEPVEGLAGKYDVEYMIGEDEGLRVRLYPKKKEYKKIDVVFSGYAESYRYVSETFSWKTCSDLSKKYGSNFYGEWSLFKVKNSDYLKWLSEESFDYIKDFSFTHFSIIGVNSSIDVLARDEPEIIFIDE